MTYPTMIYQVAVGNTPAYYETCIDSVARYCKKFDIHHIVQRKPHLNIKPLNNQRQGRASMKMDYLPIFEKENAFGYVQHIQHSGFMKACIIDADIYIRDNAPNIFDEFGVDVAFAGVRECDMPLTAKYRKKIQGFSTKQYEMFPEIMKEHTKENGVPFYNMGMMCINVTTPRYYGTKTLNGVLMTNNPTEFIRRKDFEGFVNGEGHWKWSTDQTLLNYWVKTSGMPVKNLDWRWNALVKAVQDDRLEEAYFLHFVLAENMPNPIKNVQMIAEDPRKAKTLKWGHG